jgi:ankyrin repeat protein
MSVTIASSLGEAVLVSNQENIHSLIRDGSVDSVEAYLASGGSARYAGPDRRPLLCEAALAGQRKIAEMLIHAGALLVDQDGTGRTPFAWAARCGDSGLVAFFLGKPGCEDVIDRLSTSGASPISEAAAEGHHEAVELILAHPCEDRTTRNIRISRAANCAMNQAVDEVRACKTMDVILRAPFAHTLLEGAPVDDFKRNILQVAADRGYVSVLAMILEHGIAPDLFDTAQCALAIAAIGGDNDRVQILLQHAADVNVALHGIAHRYQVRALDRHLHAARKMIVNGAHPDVAGRDGKTPRQIAAEAADSQMTQVFAAYDARRAIASIANTVRRSPQ